MNAINKRKLIKQLTDNGLFAILPSWSFPPNVIDKLLDISIEHGHILGAMFIQDFFDFNNIYKSCAIDDKDEKELNNYFKLIDIYMYINKLHNQSLNNDTSSLLINVYNLFDDKKKSFQTLSSVIDIITKFKIEKEDLLKYLANINQYLLLSRKYYSDEVIYLSRIISQLENLRQSSTIDKLIKYDEKLAGIYDIDEEKIKELETKIDELKNKFESIETNANKNMDTYKKIDGEIQQLLNDISKFKIEKTKKVFKIIELSEKVEKQRLLKLVQRYNKNFNFRTNDTSWFCKNVIDKLGVEYVANSKYYNNQYSISIAYQNNQIELLSQILKLNPSFIIYNSIILNKEVMELFGIDTITKKFNDREMQDLISRLYEKKEIIFLKQLLDINPNFKFSDDLNWFNKDVIDIFGIEFIAKNFNIHIQYFIYQNFYYGSNSYSLLKKINDINPKFIVNPLLSELYRGNILKIQNLEYIANIDIYRTKTINYFEENYELSTLNDILAINPNFIINDYITENEKEETRSLKRRIIDYIIVGFNPNEIIKMFENDSINYKKLYNCAVLINNTNKSEDKFEFKFAFYEMPEEYKNQIFNLDFIDQDDIAKLDSFQQKLILRKLNAILRNYKIQKNVKKLIKKKEAK